MSNKYVYMIVAAVIFVAGTYVGLMDFFKLQYSLAGLSEDWWLGMILAAALGAGSTGGNDVVSILVEGIKGYISTMVSLFIFGFVGGAIFLYVMGGGAIDPMYYLKVGLTLAASSLTMNLTLSYIRKSI